MRGIPLVAMAYRTVNLKPATYDRLAGYRVLGQSFDDVVQALMARVPAKSVHGDLVRKAARELEVQGAADDTYVEFREMARGGPGVKGIKPSARASSAKTPNASAARAAADSAAHVPSTTGRATASPNPRGARRL